MARERKTTVASRVGCSPNSSTCPTRDANALSPVSPSPEHALAINATRRVVHGLMIAAAASSSIRSQPLRVRTWPRKRILLKLEKGRRERERRRAGERERSQVNYGREIYLKWRWKGWHVSQEYWSWIIKGSRKANNCTILDL